MTTKELIKKSIEEQTNVLDQMVKPEFQEKFDLVMNQIQNLQNLADNKDANQLIVAASRAKAIVELKTLFPIEYIKGLRKGLEGSPLGYKTDKDGKTRKDNNLPDLYSDEIVRDCFIVAMFNGFNIYDNELAIIGGNPYFTKDAFQNKFKRDERYDCYKQEIGIAEYDLPNKRALLECEASVKYKGKMFNHKEKISVKLTIDSYGNNWTGDDQARGKAERKLMARLVEKCENTTIKDADIEEIHQENKFNNAQETEIVEVELKGGTKIIKEKEYLEMLKTQDPVKFDKYFKENFEDIEKNYKHLLPQIQAKKEYFEKEY